MCIIAACPLAFGEVGVKNRVKSVLNYKKPAFWIVVTAIVVSIAVAVCFLTNPEKGTHFGISSSKSGSDLNGISIEIINANLSAPDPFFDLKWTNKTSERITFGEEFAIFYYQDGGWENCSIEENPVWNLIAYLLNTKSTVEHTYKLNGQIMTQTGKYRFEAPFTIDGKSETKYKAWIEFELKEGVDGITVHTFKPIELVYDDGMYSFVQTVESAPTYMIVNGMQLVEKTDDSVSEPIGTFEEITLNKDNFDSRFRSQIDYSWLTNDTLKSLKDNNKRIWQLHGVLNTETPHLYILLEQKDGTFYLGFGYYNCNSTNPTNADDSHIRWLYKLEEISVSNVGSADNSTNTIVPVDSKHLKEKYPQFFNVSTDGGLTVYIWQMSKDNYSCYLANTSMEAISDNSFAYDVGASIAEMRAILTTYNIDQKDITVRPVINPLSSYYYDIDDAYRAKVKELFWQGSYQISGTNPHNKVYDVTLSFANWTDDSKIYTSSLNLSKMQSNSIQHLPIYKFDSLKDLKQFKETFNDILTMDSGWDEVPSFNEATAKYDTKFFEDNCLMLVYVSASNCTHRFVLGSIGWDEKSFCINVVETTGEELVDEAMAGWFLTVAVEKETIASCTEFDADLNNEIKLY